MKIALIGTGGIGGYFGACLIADGQEVHLVSTARHVEAISTHGLRITTDDGDRVVHPASVTTDPHHVGEVDLVLVALKMPQLRAGLDELAPLVGPHTVVVSLQNGVSAPEMLVHALGGGHVVPGLAVIVSWVEGPGHIRQIGGAPGLVVGEHLLPASRRPTPSLPDPDAPPTHSGDPLPSTIAELVAALRRQGVRASTDRDIDHALWVKFALIATFGAVNTLAHATIGEVRSFAPTRALMLRSLEEVRQVAATRGVDLTPTDLSGVLDQLDAVSADSTTSMQRDLTAGRESELPDLNGALVDMADRAGLDIPFQRTATAVLSLHALRGHV
ncbi:MAG: 2-dehydropantoate 2-reductase [Propionibacterium sp.]|nr:2-dehydropantoate 2-reductase [Propionibacterium sp.]